MIPNVLMNYSKRVLRAQPRSTKQKYNQHIFVNLCLKKITKSVRFRKLITWNLRFQPIIAGILTKKRANLPEKRKHFGSTSKSLQICGVFKHKRKQTLTQKTLGQTLFFYQNRRTKTWAGTHLKFKKIRKWKRRECW